MAVALAVTITVLLCIAASMFNRDFLSPGFLITLGFWIASICCLINNSAWKLRDYRTFFLIVFGLIAFYIGCGLANLLHSHKLRAWHKGTVEYALGRKYIKVSEAKLVAYMIFQMILLVYIFRIIVKNVGSQKGLEVIISSYYNMGREGGYMYSLGVANIANIVNMSGIYLLIYICVKNAMNKRKNYFLMYINILLGVVISIITGTKTTAFMYLVAVVVDVFVIKNINSGWRGNINVKLMFKLLMIFFVAILGFGLLNSVQGRTLSNMSFVEVISTYMGSSLKNLELFIQSKKVNNTGIFGAQTLINTYSWFYELTGNSAFNIESQYIYRWFGGHGLGNVYSIYMPLLYDFGYTGSFAMMAIVGFISQKCYLWIRHPRNYKNYYRRIIIYSYVAFSLIFSFFSNKFFECVISRSMIYFVVGLLIFELCFFKFRFANMKIKMKSFNTL